MRRPSSYGFDLPLLLVVLGLTILGLVMIYSATRSPDYVIRQLRWVPISWIAFVLTARIDYVELMRVNRLIYFSMLLLLILVLLPPVGRLVNGARSWIPLGPLGNLQPSEYSKVAIVVTLGTLLRRRQLEELSQVAPAFLHVGLPMLLILVQPDFGTAMVFIIILFAMLYAADLGRGWIVGCIGVGVVSVPLLFRFVLKEYQRKRLLIFLNPNADPLNAGWNVVQSLVSVGSGRLLGKGLFAGTQGRLGFLPEGHNDFIFALISEELGFVGSSLVLAAYLFVVLRAVRIALDAKDDFGKYIAVGIAAMYLGHIIINVGMTLGVMPVTGIPLPFVSYGGSSLLTNYVGLALLISVDRRTARHGPWG